MHSDDNMHCATLTTNTVKYQSLLAVSTQTPTHPHWRHRVHTRTKVNYAPGVVTPNQYSVGQNIDWNELPLASIRFFRDILPISSEIPRIWHNGNFFGRDCLAANVILGMNKLRYNDGKGYLRGFVAFLDRSNLTRSILPKWKSSVYPFPQCRDPDWTPNDLKLAQLLVISGGALKYMLRMKSHCVSFWS